MNIDELNKKGYRLMPYLNVEQAFLDYVNSSKSFKSNGNSTYFHNGRENPKTGLKPRELLGLSVAANAANFLSGSKWTPGALLEPDGSVPPGAIAHDGLIKCTNGEKAGQFMWFEQVMATHKAYGAKPKSVEEAILSGVLKKSQKGSSYGVDNMALIIFVDIDSELIDLKRLAAGLQTMAYRAIYMIAALSKDMKDYVCVILKSPGDTLGPIRVSFRKSNGEAIVCRML